MRKLSLIILSITVLALPMVSQDFIFSQYFASQPYLNPAMTGFFDGSYRVNAHYRTQWNTINSGISTYGVNGEMKFGDHEGEKDYVGLGAAVYRDDLYGMIANNTGRINVSYNKRLGYGLTKHFLALGANFGMDYRQVKTNFIYPDGVSSTEYFQKPDLFIPNLGLGLNYQVVFPSFANVFFGGSVDHLVSDKASIFNTNETVAKRYTIYTSARLRVSDAVFILPTLLTVNQGNHRQINYGVTTQLLMREYYNYKTNLQLGVFARMGNEGFDAMIAMVRYENRGVQLGASYDHNLNELSSATGGFGAIEFSLGYVGFIERILKSRSNCPNIQNF
jgi:type IX secretion system PorP/SprF family membrane protein